jgi:hypothetical protein
MKNLTYLLLFFLFISSPTVFAVPPYLGVSVAENLAFKQQTCLSTAKKILKKDGFQKIVQFRRSMTIFAAYRNKKRYSYKALVKCLSKSGVIFVVAVAQVAKHARQKAESLRKKIQKKIGTTKHIPNQSMEIESTKPIEEIDTTKRIQRKKVEIDTTKHIQNQSIDQVGIQKHIQNQVDDEYHTIFSENECQCEDFEEERRNNIIEEWQSTLLSQKDCLSRAEMSLRDSGFYRKIRLLEDSISGKNANDYEGLIKCISANNQIYFQVKGKNTHTREELLDKLEFNF